MGQNSTPEAQKEGSFPPNIGVHYNVLSALPGEDTHLYNKITKIETQTETWGATAYLQPQRVLPHPGKGLYKYILLLQ